MFYYTDSVLENKICYRCNGISLSFKCIANCLVQLITKDAISLSFKEAQNRCSAERSALMSHMPPEPLQRIMNQD